MLSGPLIAAAHGVAGPGDDPRRPGQLGTGPTVNCRDCLSKEKSKPICTEDTGRQWGRNSASCAPMTSGGCGFVTCSLLRPRRHGLRQGLSMLIMKQVNRRLPWI